MREIIYDKFIAAYAWRMYGGEVEHIISLSHTCCRAHQSVPMTAIYATSAIAVTTGTLQPHMPKVRPTLLASRCCVSLVFITCNYTDS